MEKVKEGNNRDKQGKGRKGKGKERKWKGHGSQWLDGCDVGNAPSSERELPLSISFPSNKTASIHPSFLFHPHIYHLNNFIHPPPPPQQHFPIISHQPHTSPPSTCLSAVCLSPHQPPRAPIALGEEKRREKRREEKTQKQQLTPSSIRPPTSEAIGHRPRHPLQPCRIPRRPGPRLWRHIPPRYASKQQ